MRLTLSGPCDQVGRPGVFPGARESQPVVQDTSAEDFVKTDVAVLEPSEFVAVTFTLKVNPASAAKTV
jgi:hypothetical protein